MKNFILVVVLLFFISGCKHQVEYDSFMLANIKNGHKLGPFKFREGESIAINGREFKIIPDPLSEQSQILIRKLKAYKFKHIDFTNVNTLSAIEYVTEEAGVHFIVDKDLSPDGEIPLIEVEDNIDEPNLLDEEDDAEMADDEIIPSASVTNLHKTNISAFNALNIICQQAKIGWDIQNSVIIISKRDLPDLWPDWEYKGDFNKLIDLADRIVIRDGGYNCCGPVDKQNILLEIKDPKRVKEFNKHIQFEKKQEWEACMCCGWPGIDWYKGDVRLALAAVQHGFALRWRDFPGDASLTKKSSTWLVKFLLKHKIDRRGEYKKILEKKH